MDFSVKGVEDWGKASTRQASERNDKGKLVEQTLMVVRQVTSKSYLGQTMNASLKTKFY
jgi:hypothetical protein